jgi:hypothetical protein
MGGSGGGGGFSSDGFKNAGDLLRDAEDAKTKISQEQFSIEVSEQIADLLASVNDRDTVSIQQHLTMIREALSSDIEESVELKFAGSVSRHTYVDGLSDVDALVILNGTELASKEPSFVRSYFADRLRERLPKTEIREGSLAVTVVFSDAEIQLVPVIRSGRELRISSESENAWTSIKPLVFSRALRNANDHCGGKLVPTIKLAKAVMVGLPPERRLRGYHTEMLAMKIFDDYAGPLTPKDMLKHFFTAAPAILNKTKLRDITGQSRYVDDYLGGVNSLNRKLCADSLDRIGRKLRNADAVQSIDMWRGVLTPEDGS